MLMTFENLVKRFGEISAWHYLAEIEKASGIRPYQFFEIDPEARLARACQIRNPATVTHRTAELSPEK